MAFVDRDNSREKAISGVASVVVVGVVGYAMVTGLAMTVVREMPWVIPTQSYPAPPRPVPRPEPTHKIQRPTTPDHGRIDKPPVTIVPTDPTTETIDIGPVGPTFPPEPPQPPQPPQHPQTADQSAGAQPAGNSGEWVTAGDYPPSAEREGVQGRTVFRLDIGANGRVTNCTVLASSGSDDLDRTACRLLTSRARFKAARDADGNPAPGSYSGGVTWKMPID